MDLPQLIAAKSLSLLIVLLLHFSQKSQANHCTPSACGVIRNISSPFRLKGDPKNCGHRKFELVCENDVAFLYLGPQKYYVKAINSSRIRLVDASITNDTCSFPIYSLYHYNFTQFIYPYHPYPYEIESYSNYPYDDIPTPINFLSCPNPLKNSSLFTYINRDCAPYNNRYAYIKIGHMNASYLTEKCMLEKIVLTSWKFKDPNNASLSDIHDSLLYGFELSAFTWSGTWKWPFDVLSWVLRLTIPLIVVGLLCAVVSPPVMAISGFAAVSLLLLYITKLLLSLIDEDILPLDMAIQLFIDPKRIDVEAHLQFLRIFKKNSNVGIRSSPRQRVM